MEIDKVILNLKDMLIVRGEDVTEFEEHADLVERSRYYTEPIELTAGGTTVVFALHKRVVQQIYGILRQKETAAEIEDVWGTKNIILVLAEEHAPSTVVMNTLAARERALATIGGLFQHFYLHELMYNPSKHVLVPRHEKLTEAQAREVMDLYSIKNRAQLPAILKTDMMARWLGLRHGELVKITRHNTTSGSHAYYRCCM